MTHQVLQEYNSLPTTQTTCRVPRNVYKLREQITRNVYKLQDQIPAGLKDEQPHYKVNHNLL